MRRLSCGIVVNRGRETANDLDLSSSLVMEKHGHVFASTCLSDLEESF